MEEHDRADALGELASQPRERELVIDSNDDAGTRVLTLRGELDIASAPRLEQEIDSALAKDAGALVIDLAELEFMDSTGLRALILGQRRAAEARRGFAIARHPEQFVARVFTLAGADRALEIYDSRADAIAALRR